MGQVRFYVRSVNQKQEVSKVYCPVIHRETVAYHVLAEVSWVPVWQTDRQTESDSREKQLSFDIMVNRTHFQKIYSHIKLGVKFLYNGKRYTLFVCFITLKTQKIFYEIRIYYWVVYTKTCQRKYFVSRRSGGNSPVPKGQNFWISKKNSLLYTMN
jgi:hypothetical protein